MSGTVNGTVRARGEEELVNGNVNMNAEDDAGVRGTEMKRTKKKRDRDGESSRRRRGGEGSHRARWLWRGGRLVWVWVRRVWV